MPNTSAVLPDETNIVIFNLSAEGPDAATVVKRLLMQGIRAGVFGERTIRIVTHIGVDQEKVDLLCECPPDALSEP